MFSCLGRLVALLLTVAIAAVLWFTQDAWLPKLRARLGAAPPPIMDAKWEPLTAEGAARGRAAFEKLSEKNGPVYVNLTAGDFAAFALDTLLRGVSVGVTGAEAIARDDHLSLRAVVNVSDLGDPSALGPLAGLVSGRQQITLRGRIDLPKPGRGQFRVDEVSIGDLKLPSAMIERLVGRVAMKDRDASVAADAIPFHVSRTLGDVRVGKGRVTLYKNVP